MVYLPTFSWKSMANEGKIYHTTIHWSSGKGLVVVSSFSGSLGRWSNLIHIFSGLQTSNSYYTPQQLTGGSAPKAPKGNSSEPTPVFHVLLLMVQNSGIHQLRLVVWPIIYDGSFIHSRWFSRRISEASTGMFVSGRVEGRYVEICWGNKTHTAKYWLLPMIIR